MPEIFDQPHSYVLLKSNGVGTLHLVLRDLLIKMHQGRRQFIAVEFLTMLEGSDLLGNSEFWKSENEDGARNYSGRAGWSDLAKHLIRDIEEGSVVFRKDVTTRSTALPADNTTRSDQVVGSGLVDNNQQSGQQKPRTRITRGPREGLVVRIHWELINKGQSEDVSQVRAADTFQYIVERLASVLGNDVLDQLEKWKSRRGQLLSKNPNQFTNKKNGKPYSSPQIATSGYYLCTHSSTADKSMILEEMLNVLKLPKELFEFRVIG